MKPRTLSFCLTLVAFAAPAGAAFAQEAPPPAPVTGETARTHGATRAGAGLGVGAAAFVSGMGGPEVVYDFGAFHVEGLFGFDHRTVGGGPNPPSVTTFDLGASGWYHLHAGDRSDFSVGGGLGFMIASPSQGNSANAIVLEPGVEARVFLTDNFALSGRLALDFVFGDAVNAPPLGGMSEHTSLAGQIVTGFGFTYYFR
ncbi:MAG TPA: hypothetical protein VHJ20_02710 [Polyangia bacterium]|nr:hypothetical protein [Polyangia bacterium]